MKTAANMNSNENNERITNNKPQNNFINIPLYWFLGFTSLPMIGGAYIGFQREMKKQAKILPNQQTVNGALLASKALGIGTLLSIGGFGIISAGTDSVTVQFIMRSQTTIFFVFCLIAYCRVAGLVLFHLCLFLKLFIFSIIIKMLTFVTLFLHLNQVYYMGVVVNRWMS